jgi:hypothetical protein
MAAFMAALPAQDEARSPRLPGWDRFFAAFLPCCIAGSSRRKLDPITGHIPNCLTAQASLRIPGQRYTRPLEATAIRSHQAALGYVEIVEH